jgi:hypothetical protein
MGDWYRYVGNHSPTDHTQRVVVEDSKFDFETGQTTPGKVLVRGGDAVYLEDYQRDRVGLKVQLEQAEAPDVEGEGEIVDQPLLGVVSTSTENPPFTGTTPNLSDEKKEDLVKRAEAAGLSASGKTKSELRTELEDHYDTKGV